MSTKVTLKWRPQTESQPGFHLYEDVMDYFGDDGARDDAPVYLQLDRAALDLRTLEGGGAWVTVVFPRELAVELGLLPISSRAGPSQGSTGRGEERK